MRIVCPFCGERDSEEFATIGGVAGPRPHPAASDAQELFHAYVYLRDNPAGPHDEHWYHAQGCRHWLIVTRNTKTHEILSVVLVRP